MNNYYLDETKDTTWLCHHQALEIILGPSLMHALQAYGLTAHSGWYTDRSLTNSIAAIVKDLLGENCIVEDFDDSESPSQPDNVIEMVSSDGFHWSPEKTG